MKQVRIHFILIFFSGIINAQTVHHEMLSAQGGSAVVENGYSVNFTVGQQSVTGTSVGGFIVQQGFQQNVWYRLDGPNKNDIAVKLYPNPFVETINFSFSKPLNHPLKLTLFDLLGRIIKEKTITVESQQSSLTFPVLAAAEYIIVLSSPEINQSFKIIKK